MNGTLDEFLPMYRQRAVHSIRLAAPPEQVWAALSEVTLADLPVARALLTIRTLPTRLRGGPLLTDRAGPIAEVFRQDNHWVTLVEEPGRVLVLGRVARFWQPVPRDAPAVRSAEDFLDFDRPGFAKAVISHEVIPDGTGSLLVTETRVVGTDPRARRQFAVYWRLIRPGVGVIRRSVLQAVARRCQAPSPVR